MIPHCFGRGLQILSLLMMPSAIWVAEFKHSEQEAITVFAGSVVIFFIGWIFARIR